MAKHLKNSKINKSMLISILIIILAFIPILVYAKYIGKVSGNAKTGVSKVYYSIEPASETTNQLENKVFKDIYFNVNNYDENNNLNQVLMKYYIQLNVPDTNFSKTVKLFYQDENENWVEINNITTGDFTGYYEGKDKLGFQTKTQHKYKIEVISTDNILVNENFNIDVNLKLIQTQN